MPVTQASVTQTITVSTVTTVKTSLALAPSALCPETPPNAPARPPPRPRCNRMTNIRNRLTSISNVNRKYSIVPLQRSLSSRSALPDPLGCPDDRQEIVDLQAGTADKRPVHIGLLQQRPGVLRFDTATVEYSRFCRDS